MQEFYAAASKAQPLNSQLGPRNHQNCWFSSVLTHWQSSQMRKAPSVASSWLSWMSTLITCTGWHVSCSLEFKSVENKTQQQNVGWDGIRFYTKFFLHEVFKNTEVLSQCIFQKLFNTVLIIPFISKKYVNSDLWKGHGNLFSLLKRSYCSSYSDNP